MRRRSAPHLCTSALAVTGTVVASLALMMPAAQALATCGGQTATIVGTGHRDVLHGTPADDVVWLGKGKDDFYGAGGDDIICGGNGRDTITGDAGEDVIYGGAGKDPIAGGADDDQLFGEAGKDTLVGDAGNDRMDGGADNDYIEEGAGNDRIVGGDGSDFLTYRLWRTGVHVDSAARTISGAGQDTASEVETYEGTDHADVMVGGAGDDDLRSRRGADRVDGRGGVDFLQGREGVLKAGPGNDSVEVSGTATAYLGTGIDSANVTGGRPKVYGGADGDFLGVAAPGSHATFDGGEGYDQIGFRKLPRGVRANIGTGTVTWRGGDLRFTSLVNVIGSKLNDVLVGSADADVFFGLKGRDSLRGLAGNDTLIGGGSPDNVVGGTGYDLCSGERRTQCEGVAHG